MSPVVPKPPPQVYPVTIMSMGSRRFWWRCTVCPPPDGQEYRHGRSYRTNRSAVTAARTHMRTQIHRGSVRLREREA